MTFATNAELAIVALAARDDAEMAKLVRELIAQYATIERVRNELFAQNAKLVHILETLRLAMAGLAPILPAMRELEQEREARMKREAEARDRLHQAVSKWLENDKKKDGAS